MIKILEQFTNKSGITIQAMEVDERGGMFYRFLKDGSTPLCTLHFQSGHPDAVGINGLTNEDVISMLLHRLGSLQKKVPCAENERAIYSLKNAMDYLESRTKDRRLREIEGTDKP